MSDLVARLGAALEGRYRIERPLGEGGMATVFLAEDLRHARKVALKVLKPELAAAIGAERFLAEIRTTASLRHPHILPLFDSGEADSSLYYLMPYLEGESLRARLDRERQVPVDEAVGIAIDVAEALDYAHRHGVIHRDVKPGNILLQDGKPIVSDFGIALAVGAAGAGRLTETGVSVGTPQYMSPEQATGDSAVGPAADVYALGCVLYEMLTGDPPYTGRTPQAILGKVIQGGLEPVRRHRASVPPNVEAAIERALEKVPADRFVTSNDFAVALRDPSFRHRESHTGAGTSPGRAAAVAGWATAAVATAVAALVLLQPAPAGMPVSRYLVTAPELASIEAPFGLLAAVAPDGSSMLLPVGPWPDSQLGLKLRSAVEITPLSGTEGARAPVYSPDGAWIAYTLGDRLVKRSLGEGAMITLAEDTDAPAAAIAWLDDGTILYEQMSSGEGFVSRLVRIPEDGGAALAVYSSSEAGAGFPIWMHPLPDARGALVVTCGGTATCTAEAAALYVLDLERGSLELLMPGVMRAWHVPAVEHVVFVRADGSMHGMPFDSRTLRATGGPVPLLRGVRVGAAQADMVLGGDGSVLYVEGVASAYGLHELVWVDRAGREELVDPALPPSGITTLSLAPDDGRLATSIESVLASEIWVKELPDGPFTRLTEHAGATRWPQWTGDGQHILYLNNEGGTPHVRRVRADGASGMSYETVLVRDGPVMEAIATPDGRGIYFREGQPPYSEARIGLLDTATGQVMEEPRVMAPNQQSLALSPDQRWLAFVSDLSGRREVFVRGVAETDARVQVSIGGGFDPVWGHGGTELFYREPGGAMMVAAYEDAGGFRVRSRAALFDAGPYFGGLQPRATFDVTADDQRFVMMRPSSAGARLVLIEGWLRELRERTR